MRLQMTLLSQQHQTIPFNYNYLLAAGVYKALSKSSQYYSDFLHNQGYLGPDGKLRKLFTLSGLSIKPKPRVSRQGLLIGPSSRATFVVASPMDLDFVKNFLEGILSDTYIELANSQKKAVLTVYQIEALPEPLFTSPCRFRALSPIVVTTPIEYNGSISKHYLRPDDPELSTKVRQSLVKKYQTFFSEYPDNDQLDIKMDTDYLKTHKYSRMVTLHQGTPRETRIKGFIAPFTLTGSTELMRMAWLAGIGDQCSMGFGCVDVDKK